MKEEKRVYPRELKVGDKLCYWAYRRGLINSPVITSKVQLSTNIVEIKKITIKEEDKYIVYLDLNRIVICFANSLATIEYDDEVETTVAHIGKSTTCGGVSID